MNNDALRSALSIVIEQDYAPFLTAQKNTFSPRFEKRMNRLIKRERQPIWRFTNTFGKRLALTVLLIALALAGLFSVSASARETVIQMIHRVSSGHIDYYFQGASSRPIEETISFSSVPDGYEIIEYDQSPSIVRYRFRNPVGDIIELEQTVARSLTADTDKHILKHFTISKTAVDLYVCTIEQSMFAIWSIDRYIIILTVYGNYTEEDVLSWIPLVELKK